MYGLQTIRNINATAAAKNAAPAAAPAPDVKQIAVDVRLVTAADGQLRIYPVTPRAANTIPPLLPAGCFRTGAVYTVPGAERDALEAAFTDAGLVIESIAN